MTRKIQLLLILFAELVAHLIGYEMYKKERFESVSKLSTRNNSLAPINFILWGIRWITRITGITGNCVFYWRFRQVWLKRHATQTIGQTIDCERAFESEFI